jgi:hypothetical protein
MIASAIAWMLVQSGGLTANMHPEEEVKVHGLASTGTGISLAGRANHSLIGRSPFFVNLGAAFSFSQRPWLELEAGAQFEVERRVGIALVPKIRAFLPKMDRLKVYTSFAIPTFVFPYSLYGIAGGVGARLALLRYLDASADATISGFFGGSDLPKGQGLAKFDLALGVVAHF